MSDPFDGYAAGLESPATGAFEIAPDDNADLPFVTRALNVQTTGAVRVSTLNGDTVTLFIAAGGVLPIRVSRVLATGTTATNIVGLY